MEYRLYIQKLNGTWKLADMGDDKPAMNYQINNLAELKDRQADYSQALKLPFSTVNCDIFEYANEVDVVTSTPYKRLNCRLFSYDHLIAGPGSYIVISSIDENFNIQILSGNADFFTTIDEELPESLLGYYTVGSKTVLDGYIDSNYAIPVVGYLVDVANNPTILTESDKAVPFAILKNAIEKICYNRGYSLITNALGLDSKAISTCTRKATENSLIPMNSVFYGKPEITNQSQNFLFHKISNEAENIGGFEDRAGITVIIDTDCDITIKYTGLNQTQTGDTCQINTIVMLSRDGLNTKLFEDDHILSDFNSQYTYEFTYSLLKGDNLFIQTTQEELTTDFNTTLTYFLNFSVVDTSTIPDKCRLYIAPNLGFSTQLDLFKAFMQLNGLTCLVNENKVYCYTTEIFYINKNVAFDWSKKLAIETPTITYILDNYGKLNNITLTVNSSDDSSESFTNTAQFQIDNDSLENEVDLFEIAIESGNDYSFTINSSNIIASNIPYFDYTSDDDSYNYKGGKSHIVDISYQKLGTATIIVAKSIKLNSMINSNYNYLINGILNKTKSIEASLLLTDEDIEIYKSVKDNIPQVFVPVYFRQFGSYFYINKIKNFVSGELTKCELIRL